MCQLWLVVLLCAVATPSIAQENIDVHASVGASFIAPLGQFSALGGVPTPSELTFTSSAVSLQPRFTLGADAEFLPKMPALRFGGRVGMQWYQLDYGATERVPIATEDGGTYPATLGHELDLSFGALFIEPYAQYQVYNWLAVDAGLPFQIPLGSDYTQTMQFTDPPGLPFLDGSTVITTGAGAVPGLSALVPSLSLGAEGAVPINARGSLMLMPRAGMTIPITAWETESGIRTIAFSLSIGVRFLLREWPDDPRVDAMGRVLDTTVVRDTVVILSSKVTTDSVFLASTSTEEYPNGDTVNVLLRRRYQKLIPKPPSVLKASVALAFELEDGTLIDEARLTVRTVERTRTVPILPVVVFDESGTSIPGRYRQLSEEQARVWTSPAALREQGVHWQYHVLNIIGERLRTSQGSRIDLISYDDGTEQGAALNAQRTASVQEYLTKTFGIAKSRVGIDNRRGQASQQPWVFIADESRAVLAPITATDTILESRLPRVRIRPDVVSETRLRSWVIAMSKGADTLTQRRGEGGAPGRMIWDMNDDISPEATMQGAPVLVTLTVVDREGSVKRSEPGRVVVKGASNESRPDVSAARTEVLRWIGPDYLHTSDLELFGLAPEFDRIDVYPSASRREDFFVVQAPATVHPVGAAAWFRQGLHPAELRLFDHAEVYTKRERRP